MPCVLHAWSDAVPAVLRSTHAFSLPIQPSGSMEGGYFCSVDQILESSEAHPQLKLLAASAGQCLPLVCDQTEAGGDSFYRLNDDMVLAWRLDKLPIVRGALEGVLGGMDEEAQLAYSLGFLVCVWESLACLPLSPPSRCLLPPILCFFTFVFLTCAPLPQGDYLAERWIVMLAQHLKLDLAGEDLP